MVIVLPVVLTKKSMIAELEKLLDFKEGRLEKLDFAHKDTIYIINEGIKAKFCKKEEQNE